MWTWWYAAYNSFLMAISNYSKFQVLGEIVVLHFSFLSRTSLHNNLALKHGHIHMIEKQTPWPEIISNDPMTCDTYLITACQAEKKRSSNNLLSTSKQNQIAVCFRGVQGKMCLVRGKKRKKEPSGLCCRVLMGADTSKGSLTIPFGHLTDKRIWIVLFASHTSANEV